MKKFKFLAPIITLGILGLYSSIYKVNSGEKALLFDRYQGLKPAIYG
jgi:hypothetical protein